MKTSETINELATALAKAQAVMGNAHFNRQNPHFKSKFADLASVRDTITPALTTNGISVVQMTSVGNESVIVHTRLMHSSGQWIESEYPIINDPGKPQAMGSALSYARRYSLSAICNIASEEDDDGNEAQNSRKPEPPIERDVFGLAQGTKGASKAGSRPEYEKLTQGIRNAPTLKALNEWLKNNQPEIDKQRPDWVDELRVEFMDRKAELTKALAA